MIFVDTGAWYASTVPDDANHSAPCQWLDGNDQPLVTTDYIVDETLTLFKMRGYPQVAMEWGDALLAGELAEIIAVSEIDFLRAWQIFRQFRDKEWSFTDCTSKAVMERLGIVSAFAFDHHFRQFSSVTVVPAQL